MRVLVCGSRHFNDYGKMYDVLIEYVNTISTLIHGDARGADRISQDVIEDMFLTLDYKPNIKRYPADWEKHGKAAGPIRNKQMLDEGKPDMVIAFLAKDSRGTKNMIEQAEKAGVPVKVINV